MNKIAESYGKPTGKIKKKNNIEKWSQCWYMVSVSSC
jgi:hypothetical protein